MDLALHVGLSPARCDDEDENDGEGHCNSHPGRHEEEARERHARHLVPDVERGVLLSVDVALKKVDAASHLHDACAVEYKDMDPVSEQHHALEERHNHADENQRVVHDLAAALVDKHLRADSKGGRQARPRSVARAKRVGSRLISRPSA